MLLTRALVLVVGIACMTGVARAETAEQLFAQGREQLQQEHYEAACAKFQAAIALDPDAAGVMLNLGLCHEKLHHLATALRWFRRAQARAAETYKPEYENAAKDHTQALAAAVPTVQLKAPSIPHLWIEIDGETVPTSEYGRREADAGHHVLTAHAPHRLSLRKEIEVASGVNVVEVELAEGEDTTLADPGAGRRRTARWIALGGGVLMLASAGLTRYEYGAYTDAKRKLAAGDPGARDDANHATTIARYWGTGLFAGGLAAVGVAAVIYFTAPDKEEVRRVAIAPAVTSSAVGLSLTGAF